MRAIIFTVCYLLFVVYSFGQINGTFLYSPGMGGISLTLDGNFKYKYEDFTCVTKRTDTGIYELHHDTIIFHSSLKPDGLVNRTISIGSMYSLLKNGKTEDTLFVLVRNKTGINHHSASIRVRDSLIQFIDTIHADETRSFSFPVNTISGSFDVTLDINNEISKVSEKTNFIAFDLYSDSRNEKEILNDRMIYEGNRIYPLSVFEISKKKIYMELVK